VVILKGSFIFCHWSLWKQNICIARSGSYTCWFSHLFLCEREHWFCPAGAMLRLSSLRYAQLLALGSVLEHAQCTALHCVSAIHRLVVHLYQEPANNAPLWFLYRQRVSQAAFLAIVGHRWKAFWPRNL
jgi:hypothetical protein